MGGFSEASRSGGWAGPRRSRKWRCSCARRSPAGSPARTSLSMAARCSEADAIVVLGCRGPAALTRRLDRGIQLYQVGAAPLLVLSGGNPGPIAEAEFMRRAALARGVPESALLVEPVSRNTLENARETARLLRPKALRSVVLVSDRLH